jgi:MFS-type transporter involved in bile tolerance (Atg22 family)
MRHRVIHLINPKTDSLTTRPLYLNRALYSPIAGLLAVAAAIPRDRYEVVLTDENIETIDFDLHCDLVGISAMTAYVNRGYEIADEFRQRGVPVIMGAILLLVLVCVGVLSLGREHVLFAIATASPAAGDGLYGSPPEKLFVALGLVIGAVAGPLQASSRSLLARLVPPGEAGRYFGLLALSGRVTSFLAPLAVAVATELAGTQAAAPAVLIGFLSVGALLLAGVRRV